MVLLLVDLLEQGMSQQGTPWLWGQQINEIDAEFKIKPATRDGLTDVNAAQRLA